MMDNDSTKCLLAILAIASLAIVALSKGVDGQVLWLAILAITGLGGYDLYSSLKKAEAPANSGAGG